MFSDSEFWTAILLVLPPGVCSAPILPTDLSCYINTVKLRRASILMWMTPIATLIGTLTLQNPNYFPRGRIHLPFTFKQKTYRELWILAIRATLASRSAQIPERWFRRGSQFNRSIKR